VVTDADQSVMGRGERRRRIRKKERKEGRKEGMRIKYLEERKERDFSFLHSFL